ncbi:MAG: hypothetical protein DCC43_09305 [Candidatus Brocadia sp.]|jgi:predicted DCC family thiol-disulfide oxidoreductase YuxK|uniref:Thiol-disulfide oxidoreductase n=1 Tax=Candidatus Brocadia fulgida TaxID=380242 RepID=A0A0M2UXY6_9BACT|nr:MAG: hypothetical protein BROFUL_00553 [Candidatus Brocadia fulgida]MCC6325011.1 DUF393 domain-containing protein [Candidatus Brocadia sp.]MCE7911635.1 DUF393 domain-containing protein [Candidatus Brocadia sp. AMX3]OQZ00453.1 MAG: hypothetical protein B6D35_06595 [Candidatus Brocadia sp. UTAMX2]MBV6518176.1 hypothetical protein [Candidatus Brocadia fulgida]
MRKPEPVVIIYDDKCSLCRGCRRWIELHAIQRNVFEFIPCRSEERRRRFPELNDDVCVQSFQLVLPQKQILAGDTALPEILIRLRGYRWLQILFQLPVSKACLYAAYRWISNNRYLISKTIKPLIQE